jgi:uncharacterized protein (TIGR00251 family)
VKTAADDAMLRVRVVPRAGRTEAGGWFEEALIVRLAAAPVDGAANRALTDFLAELLGVPRRSVTIASGERSRNKRVRIAGLPSDQLTVRLSAGLDRLTRR